MKNKKISSEKNTEDSTNSNLVVDKVTILSKKKQKFLPFVIIT